jgi:hypothetical protein
MRGKSVLGIALSIVAGGVIAVALLPEPRARFGELANRLRKIEGLSQLFDDAPRLTEHLIAAARARYALALNEARVTGDTTRRELYAQLETAQREGRLPPLR